MILILKLLTGHFIGDFILQSSKVSEYKLNKITYLILHIITVFFAMLVCSIDKISFKLILCISIISILHVVDYLKKFLQDTVSVFLCDQLFHIISIMLVPFILGLIGNPKFFEILKLFYTSGEIWIYILGYVFGVFVGSVFVPLALSFVPSSGNNHQISSSIGKVERFLVITLSLLNQYTAIGIIFAIKGTARKVFIESDTKNGEDYLLGTMLSFLIAIITAIGMKFLLTVI